MSDAKNLSFEAWAAEVAELNSAIDPQHPETAKEIMAASYWVKEFGRGRSPETAVLGNLDFAIGRETLAKSLAEYRASKA